jgi:resuscitation-promoting factor RpfB
MRVLGAVVLVLVVGGCGAGEATGGDPQPVAEIPVSKVASPATPTPSGRPASAKTVAPKTAATPEVQKKIVVETRRIAFQQTTMNDPSMAKGTREVRTRGVPGTRRLTYEVTTVGGKQTAKRLIRQVVVKQPVDQVTAIGTKAATETSGGCDPNYSGGCVPIASDVDCAGGSGDGPEYVAGPVRVVGDDVYGLDRDHDGLGCED